MTTKLQQLMNRQRLLFTMIRFLDGGIDTVLVEYLHYLVGTGKYDITLAINVNMGELEKFLGQIPSEVKIVYINHEHFLCRIPRLRVLRKASKCAKLYDEIILNPIRRFRTSHELKRLAACNDILIDFACCFSAYLKNISIPKVGIVHFRLNPRYSNSRMAHERYLKHRLMAYDKIVTISKAMTTDYVNTFPVIADRFALIYNGKNLSHIMQRANEATLPKLQKKPYLLAVERLEESQKDISTLIKCMAILKTKYSRKMPLYVLGQGSSEHQLKQLAKNLGVSDMIHFVGFTTNPYPWIQNCEILLHSAKFEGLPTVLIEALLLNKFVISTDCPTGPREILNNGKAGILVEMQNAEAFADAIVRLTDDKTLQLELSQEIAEHKKMFLMEKTGKRFEELLSDIRE